MDTVLGSGSPWKFEFTANANPPTGGTATVEGNSPSSMRPTALSDPVSYFHSEPKGKPWPKVRYQCVPAGSTKMPWGPSISAGSVPTGMTFSMASPSPGENRNSVTSSSDSEAT